MRGHWLSVASELQICQPKEIDRHVGADCFKSEACKNRRLTARFTPVAGRAFFSRKAGLAIGMAV